MALQSSSRPSAPEREGGGDERVVRLSARGRDEGLDDAELVRRFREGNREAAGLLYDRYARDVRGVLRRALGPDQEIEDLVHEVFVQFFGSPHALREPGKIRSFLFGVAVRVASGELRRRRVRRRVALTVDGTVPDRPVLPGDGGARRAIMALYGILDELGARDRLVFVLRYLEEVTVAEVAAYLRVSEPTVKRAAARAWAHLVARGRNDPELAIFLDLGQGERR